jgi:hypothetical protein
MYDKKDIIIFGGDSFTWGEGLELYIDNPKWIGERDKLNTWSELYQKQNFDSQQFRESNRFANIVSNYFNVDPRVFPLNGGQFETPITHIEKNIQNDVGYSPNKIKCIILQFTSIQRMLLHLDLECTCKFCSITGFEKPFNVYIKYMHKHLNNDTITDIDYWALRWLEKYENIPYKNLDYNTLFQQIDIWFKPLFIRNLNLFIEKYVSKWEKIAPVYFVDSWDANSSNVIAELDEYKKRMIPLLGFDGKYYTNYSEWEKTFEYTRIVNEFPKTFNEHATLIQHQYIADSIINHLDGKK